MPDPIYTHPRFALAYDTFDGPRDDLVAYVAISDELDARRVVDLGCGTGCLALLLAATGRHVIAVDPARASLEVARAKPGSEEVVWIEGDAAAIPADTDVDLVVMTGNAAQAVLGDQAWTAMLRHVHTALVPGGCFAFETRAPSGAPGRTGQQRPSRSEQTFPGWVPSNSAWNLPPSTCRWSRSETPTDSSTTTPR